jgi:hypothetical protein
MRGFSAIEDALIQDHVRTYGAKFWSSCVIPGRSARAIRDRWDNVINPNPTRRRFTEAEDLLISQLVGTHGQRWKLINEIVGTRSGSNSVRNRYFSLESERREVTIAGQPFAVRPGGEGFLIGTDVDQFMAAALLETGRRFALRPATGVMEWRDEGGVLRGTTPTPAQLLVLSQCDGFVAMDVRRATRVFGDCTNVKYETQAQATAACRLVCGPLGEPTPPEIHDGGFGHHIHPQTGDVRVYEPFWFHFSWVLSPSAE